MKPLHLLGMALAGLSLAVLVVSLAWRVRKARGGVPGPTLVGRGEVTEKQPEAEPLHCTGSLGSEYGPTDSTPVKPGSPGASATEEREESLNSLVTGAAVLAVPKSGPTTAGIVGSSGIAAPEASGGIPAGTTADEPVVAPTLVEPSVASPLARSNASVAAPPTVRAPDASVIQAVPKKGLDSSSRPRPTSRRNDGLSIPPEKRGGRPRTPESPVADPQAGGQARRESRVRGRALAELVCRRVRAGWTIGLEADPEAGLEQDNTLECRGNALPGERGFYALPTLQSPVTLCRHENPSPEHPEAASSWEPGACVWPGATQQDPLVFRLDASGQKGRYVREPGSGLCLVVVPSSWKPDAGAHLVAEAERVLVEEGLNAYVVTLDSHASLSFAAGSSRFVRLDPRRVGVELSGLVLPDDSERQGPLFVAEPPTLVADSPGIWEDIGAVVLGAEGSGRKRWRVSFEPTADQREQALPAEFRAHEAGWFFVRLYSPEGFLLDSFDFRYAEGVWFEERTETPLLPGPDGHRQVVLQLKLYDGWAVDKLEPGAEDDVISVRLHTSAGHAEYEVTFGPNPLADKSTWAITPPRGSPQVTFQMRLRRLWWGVAADGQDVRWSDHPLRVQRDWFGPTSRMNLVLRLPKPEPVRLGFGLSGRREYLPAGPSGETRVPLRDFGDCPELRESTSARLSVWIGTDMARCLTLPPKTPKCAVCGKATLSIEDMREHVKGHLEHYYVPLNWSELVDAFPELELPKQIYLCGHDCPKHPALELRCYVRADDAGENPNTAMCTKQDHCELCKGPDGVVKHQLYLVPDAGLAKKIVKDKQVPDALRCTLCSPLSRPLSSPTRQKMLAHLRLHESQLWTYIEEE